MVKRFMRVLAVTAVFLLLVAVVAPIPVQAKRIETHELYLDAGERFQVVCVAGVMEYGFNGKDGIIGWCNPNGRE